MQGWLQQLAGSHHDIAVAFRRPGSLTYLLFQYEASETP